MSFIYSPDILLAAYKKKNYKVEEGSYKLNIFGIRSKQINANSFDDFIGVLYQDYGGVWNTRIYTGTTDPGSYWLQNPMKVLGTAIVVPGQYLKSHKLGLHKGLYEALVQTSAIKVYRDRDKDTILDFDLTTVESGLFSINIHRASEFHASIQVDKWSAGCFVIADPKDFADFMDLVKNWHIPEHGDGFNLTLFLEEDFE
ncbi:MAG: hypothetical protein WBK67_02930 [Minisyncoccales bacterium]